MLTDTFLAVQVAEGGSTEKGTTWWSTHGRQLVTGGHPSPPGSYQRSGATLGTHPDVVQVAPTTPGLRLSLPVARRDPALCSQQAGDLHRHRTAAGVVRGIREDALRLVVQLGHETESHHWRAISPSALRTSNPAKVAAAISRVRSGEQKDTALGISRKLPESRALALEHYAPET